MSASFSSYHAGAKGLIEGMIAQNIIPSKTIQPGVLNVLLLNLTFFQVTNWFLRV